MILIILSIKRIYKMNFIKINFYDINRILIYFSNIFIFLILDCFFLHLLYNYYNFYINYVFFYHLLFKIYFKKNIIDQI